MAHDETIRERALEWAVRTGDPGFDDWEAFTLWLEESPAHARAYDAVAAAVADGADLAASIPWVANDDGPVVARPVRRRWAMGALAASLALAVSVGFWLNNDRYSIETEPGEIRTVQLADGGTVVLSGDSAIELDRGDERYARLERGQALFTIVHDEKNPFVVLAGDDRLVDAGTVFDVELDADRMQLAVAEGLVLYNPGKEGVKVAPGRMLWKRTGTKDYTLAPIPPEQVGEWREGRLTFDGEGLDVIAERLTRATGVAFEAAGGERSAGSFSGSVMTASLRKDPQSLGPLLGVTMRREGERWIISSD